MTYKDIYMIKTAGTVSVAVIVFDDNDDAFIGVAVATFVVVGNLISCLQLIILIICTVTHHSAWPLVSSETKAVYRDAVMVDTFAALAVKSKYIKYIWRANVQMVLPKRRT